MTIKTFRKEQGGYALLSVMLVVSVVCAVVMLISASAVKNYQAQQDSVAQMQAKYAAMGEIEMVFAQIKGKTATGADAEEAKTSLIDAVDDIGDMIECSQEGGKVKATIETENDGVSIKVALTIPAESPDGGITLTAGEPKIESYEIGGAA